MKKKKVITAILVIIYTWIFFRETPGINYLVFCISSIVGILMLNTKIIHNANWVITATGSIISSICVTIYGDGLSVFAFILSEILMVTYSISQKSSVFIGWIYPIYSLLGSYIFMITEFMQKVQKKASDKTGSWLKIMIIAAVTFIVILFFILYRESNPLFYNFTKKINLDFISWSFVGFLLSGIFIMYSFFNARIVKWLHNWETTGSNTLSQNPNIRNIKYIEIENRTGIVLLLLLNIMLFIVNLLDLIYLWGTGGLPEGMTYSTFVHQGTGTLITSIIIAIIIILFLFRSSLNFYEKNKILKWMVFMWIAQNIFMIFSTAYRNHIYIAEYVLTYKRIGVYIYLILAGIGLITTFIKVLKVKSNWFLVRKNGTIFYFILILSCPFSWDTIITNYNISYSKIPDYSYLISLSDINLPQLLDVKWNKNTFQVKQDPFENMSRRNFNNERIYNNNSESEFNYHLHTKLFNFLKKESNKNYLSWCYKPSKVFDKIISCNNSGQIKRLYLNNNNIHSLAPLKTVSEVEQLYLANNTIYDINELGYFQKLKYLDLSFNRLQFTERMPVLSVLKTLNISNNLLKNLYFLKNFPQLETLDISTNNIYNFQGIEKAINLKSLIYQYSTVQNLAKLKYLDKLKTLDLSFARNISLETFPEIKNLQNLKLNNLNISIDLLKLNEKLKNISQLTILELSGNKINSDYFLVNLYSTNEFRISSEPIFQNLKILNISNNDLKVINTIQYYKSLTDLDISNNEIFDITPLQNLTNLKKLLISNNKIITSEVLEKFYQLTELDISRNKINSLQYLKNLKALTKLNISVNSINSIAEITNLINLKELNLSNNNIVSLTGIEKFSQLEILNISYNQINDFSPLYNLKHLKELIISDYSSVDEKNLKIQLPNTIITIIGRSYNDSLM